MYTVRLDGGDTIAYVSEDKKFFIHTVKYGNLEELSYL